MMVREMTEKLIGGEGLAYAEAYSVMNEIMSGEATSVQTAAFLVALAARGESIDEISGCAAGMRERALPVPHGMKVLEIVGTGGDHTGSFNISTTSAIVVSACGVPVAKHGNRAASSKSGAADCLEALGVNIDLPPEKCAALLSDIGICFCFAQKYHVSMKYVAPVRREMGIRTIFNILGPLTNPAKPDYQLLGVYSADMVEPLTHVLVKLGVKRVLSVYGRDGFDEISASAPTLVCEFDGNQFKTYDIAPEDFGFTRCEKSDLCGGDPNQNAAVTRAILAGEQGAKRNAVLLNSGGALYAAGAAGSIKEGVALAAEAIDSGRAERKLAEFIEYSNK